MNAPKQRTSLTKTQLQTASGMELLSICQSVTADGRLEDEEVHALHQWISTNTAHDLPAIRLLSTTLSRVLEDGIITAEERQSVASAIEAVLPPTERQYAATLRRQVSQEERLKQKAKADQERQEARDAKALNRPIAKADFMVAGTRHEGRGQIIELEISPDQAVGFLREKTNTHSRYAVAVTAESGKIIGYIPEDWARSIAPLLDDGAQYTASVKKVLEYDSGPVPVVVARFYDSKATIEDAPRLAQKTAATKPTLLHTHSNSSNTKTKLIAIGLIISALGVLAAIK